MATLHEVQAALQAAVSGAVASVTPVPIVGIGWPSEHVLANATRPGAAGLISVYDRKLSKDSTRWKPLTLSQTITVATLTSSVATVTGGWTVSLAATPTVGDAVSVTATLGSVQSAAVAIAVSGDTPATMAGKLASAVNGEATLSGWLQASASGSIVTLTALTNGLSVNSYTGNGGSEVIELGRRNRRFQVVVWANTEPQREAIGDPIEVLLAEMEIGFGSYPQGLSFADGTVGRLEVESDYYLEDSTLFDLYRRDFLLSLDYPITTTDLLYAVVAPVLGFTPNSLA